MSPDPSYAALALATRHINASTPVAVPEQVLLDAVRGGPVPPAYAHHVHAFIDETDCATLVDLVLARAVTYAQLAELADRLLPAQHPTRRWLDERRQF